MQPNDPDSAKDTVEIRPLGPFASRALLTAALVAAGALGLLAVRLMDDMSSDPAIQSRYEAMERMRSESRDNGTPADTLAIPDSTRTYELIIPL